MRTLTEDPSLEEFVAMASRASHELSATQAESMVVGYSLLRTQIALMREAHGLEHEPALIFAVPSHDV